MRKVLFILLLGSIFYHFQYHQSRKENNTKAPAPKHKTNAEITDNYLKKNGGNLNVAIEKIVKQISQNTWVEGRVIGEGGIASKQYERFEILKQIASQTQLVRLTKHQNSVVACYAAWALVDNGYPEIDVIFLQFLENKQSVKAISGCIASKNYIYEQIYQRLPGRFKSKKEKGVFWKLDSTILYNDKAKGYLRNQVLSYKKLSANHLPRIKYLAFEKLNFAAIRHLYQHYPNKNPQRIKNIGLKFINKKDIGLYNYPEVFEFFLGFRDQHLNQVILEKYDQLKGNEWLAEKLLPILQMYELK